MREGFGTCEEVHILESQEVQQLIHQTAVGEEDVQHADQNHGGDEVGRIHDGLDHLFIALVVYFIDHQSKDDGQREGGQRIERKNQSVLNCGSSIERIKETLEPFQTNPFACPDALGTGVALEGHDDAAHGHIAENQEVQQRGNNKYVQPGVGLKVLESGRTLQVGILTQCHLRLAVTHR